VNALTAYPWKIVLQNTIAVSLLSVIFGVGIIFWDRENQLNDQRRDIGHKFDALLSKIDAAVDITKSLGSYVTIHGEITQSQLELFNKSLELTEDPRWAPMAIQVAPNGIVTFEAPWTGGPHIGHDLFSDPQRKIEAIAAAQRLTSVIAGPLQLKQGGTALIVRHPILTDLDTDTPEVWGLAIALIDWAPIAQLILEIEKSSGAEVEVHVETISGTRMAYPEVSADATLPFDTTSTLFGLGSFHYSFNARYSPSGFAILLISVVSVVFFLLVAAYRSREREQNLRSNESALKKSEGLLAAGTSAYMVVDENFEDVLMSEEALKLFGYNGTEEAVPYISMYRNLTEDERQAQLQELRALEGSCVKLSCNPSSQSSKKTRSIS
jgi:sensor domain CHASE-containing protein